MPKRIDESRAYHDRAANLTPIVFLFRGTWTMSRTTILTVDLLPVAGCGDSETVLADGRRPNSTIVASRTRTRITADRHTRSIRYTESFRVASFARTRTHSTCVYDASKSSKPMQRSSPGTGTNSFLRDREKRWGLGLTSTGGYKPSRFRRVADAVQPVLSREFLFIRDLAWPASQWRTITRHLSMPGTARHIRIRCSWLQPSRSIA